MRRGRSFFHTHRRSMTRQQWENLIKKLVQELVDENLLQKLKERNNKLEQTVFST